MKLADLLPDRRGPFEVALAGAMQDDLPIPIAEAMDPAKTPEALLPHLAAHESVDLWFDDWSIERKRKMIADAPRLAKLVGTEAAAEAFLEYVDAEIVHKVSYPSRRPVGRIAVGITPIQDRPFVARFLIKVTLVAHRRAIIVGRTAVGRGAILPPSREPIRRAKIALAKSKAPETAYTVSFAHRIPISLKDGIDLDAGYKLGDYRDRYRL